MNKMSDETIFKMKIVSNLINNLSECINFAAENKQIHTKNKDNMTN